MKQFAAAGFRLREAPAGLRLTYAAFLLFVGVGLLTQIGFQAGRIGLTPGRIATYYRGGETGETMSFAKPFGHLVEVTHAHAFMMGLVFLVLAHLFWSVSALSARLKTALIGVAFGGMFADLVAPWLIRYLAAGFAWAELLAWVAIWAGAGAMVGVSLWECLAGPRPEAVPLDRTTRAATTEYSGRE